MKNISIKNFIELQNFEIDNQEMKTPLALCKEGETVSLWKDNNTIRLIDEELLKKTDALDKLVLILVSELIMVNTSLMYEMLNQQGIKITHLATHNLLNKLARRGVLTSCVLTKTVKAENSSSLQFYSVGSRGALLLRSMNVHFFNMRLPSTKPPEKLKSIVSAAQAVYALAQDSQHMRNGFTLVLKKNDAVWNNVRTYTASRDDTTYFVESVRRNADGLTDLNGKLQRLEKALNPEYKEQRENYDFIQKQSKIVIVCEDRTHVFELQDKLEVPKALAGITYFTYDVLTYSSEVILYKYDKINVPSTNTSIQNKNTTAYQFLLSQIEELNEKNPYSVMRNLILDWANGFAADEHFIESAQCLYLAETVRALEEGMVNFNGKS